MIKLNNIPDEVMDVIMPVAKETGTKPDEVVKIMLSLVDFSDAMRAVKNGKEIQGKKSYKTRG